jgi:hypothetical protein
MLLAWALPGRRLLLPPLLRSMMMVMMLLLLLLAVAVAVAVAMVMMMKVRVSLRGLLLERLP